MKLPHIEYFERRPGEQLESLTISITITLICIPHSVVEAAKGRVFLKNPYGKLEIYLKESGDIIITPGPKGHPYKIGHHGQIFIDNPELCKSLFETYGWVGNSAWLHVVFPENNEHTIEVITRQILPKNATS